MIRSADSRKTSDTDAPIRIVHVLPLDPYAVVRSVRGLKTGYGGSSSRYVGGVLDEEGIRRSATRSDIELRYRGNGTDSDSPGGGKRDSIFYSVNPVIVSKIQETAIFGDHGPIICVSEFHG